MDKIRDCGTKEWAMAMMLPEQVEVLKKWMEEDYYVYGYLRYCCTER